MADTCEVCGAALSFRNSQYINGKDVCRDCYSKISAGEDPNSPDHHQQTGPAAGAGNLRPASNASSRPLDVVVTDIQMPFGSMVVFMVKWAIAAIPAFIILIIIGYIVSILLLGAIRP